ncbi:hypothetical protein PNEG_01678 [Pneumocystis murina B123]|uniref:Coilin n=1 Tax=Pneumocystis murina (strain B123) TaxID=1069680 RepID=M7NML4_PNEMU|nr:hypothetical protein PNEG_01678 [Pneumocystis murina B123]EMR09918.1 hypothetical protein PNEG_01678 [Pneumocystis murina B123]
MRIRLATAYPLPTFKCWHSISPLSDSMTIRDLIEQIIEIFSFNIDTCYLSLELEGFHLPLNSPVSKVLRENDLIILKRINDAPEVGDGIYTMFNRGVSMGLEVSEKDKIENDTYLLKYNKRFDMFDHTERTMQSDPIKQKTSCIENEERSFSQENNSIHLNTLKNKDNSSKIKKVQPYKKKTAVKELISESSDLSSSSSSSSLSSESESASASTSTSTSTSMTSKLSTSKKSSNSGTSSKSTPKINQAFSHIKNQRPPGQGMPSTRARNIRKRKTKRLIMYKQKGILPESAKFSDLLQLEKKTGKPLNHTKIEIRPIKKYIKNKRENFISRIGNNQGKHIRFNENGECDLNNKAHEEKWQDRCIVKEIECELPNVPINLIPLTSNDKNKVSNGVSSFEDMPLLPDNIETFVVLTQPPSIGSIIAFKHLCINDNYEPILSDYKTATLIDHSESGLLTLQLAKRDQKQKKIDLETGEQIYGKFGVDTDLEHDGQLILAWNSLISPILLKEVQPSAL